MFAFPLSELVMTFFSCPWILEFKLLQSLHSGTHTHDPSQALGPLFSGWELCYKFPCFCGPWTWTKPVCWLSYCLSCRLLWNFSFSIVNWDKSPHKPLFIYLFIMLIDSISLDNPKTREEVNFLKKVVKGRYHWEVKILANVLVT